jgi:hypothetical protein
MPVGAAPGAGLGAKIAAPASAAGPGQPGHCKRWPSARTINLVHARAPPSARPHGRWRGGGSDNHRDGVGDLSTFVDIRLKTAEWQARAQGDSQPRWRGRWARQLPGPGGGFVRSCGHRVEVGELKAQGPGHPGDCAGIKDAAVQRLQGASTGRLKPGRPSEAGPKST